MDFCYYLKDLLCEMHDLIHALDICKHLEHRFNTTSLAHVLDLKRTLVNLSKDANQSMNDYLRTVKTIADSLASVFVTCI